MQPTTKQSIDNRATMKIENKTSSVDELVERVAQRTAEIIERKQYEVVVADRKHALKLREGLLMFLRAIEDLYNLPHTPTARERKDA